MKQPRKSKPIRVSIAADDDGWFNVCLDRPKKKRGVWNAKLNTLMCREAASILGVHDGVPLGQCREYLLTLTPVAPTKKGRKPCTSK